jgi:hypothetical protein
MKNVTFRVLENSKHVMARSLGSEEERTSLHFTSLHILHSAHYNSVIKIQTK